MWQTAQVADVQPTLDWYKEMSRREGGLPRCPFASVERCPRFYQSVSLLGQAGFTTQIPPDEDRRLQTAWQKSDLWPRTHERASSIMGPADDPRHFLNFCPETLFDRFGFFVTNLHGYANEIDRNVAQSRLKEENVRASDWRWTWASLTPMHYTDCPVYSPLMKDGPNHSSLPFTVMSTQRNDLDPFRVVIGLIDDSDTLLRAAYAAGLRFDVVLNDPDAYSHKTRVRALAPRILAAYDALDGDTRLMAGQAAVAELRRSSSTMEVILAEALARAGWELRDTDFVVRSPETRELFFPKGSQWDAFVVLRDLFAEARESIAIVDAYCSTKVFQMLEERSLDKLHVRILCSKYAEAVAEGAKAFTAQHGGMAVEVRKAQDFHDRFIVLDENICVHVGASIKDAGKTAFMVNRIEDQRNREAMLKQLDESWAAGTPVP